MPHYGFPGLVPGDRWCVTAVDWLRAHEDGAAAFVVLASTHERALDIVPLGALREHAVDAPPTPDCSPTPADALRTASSAQIHPISVALSTACARSPTPNLS